MSSFRPPRCPNCRRDYAGPRVQGGIFQPLILKCGHTFCRACLSRIHKLLKHELVCPQCKVSTPLPAGEASFKELPPDFYAMGLAAWTHTCSKTPDLFAHKVEFQAKPIKEAYKGKSLKGGRALCEECSQESAGCKCQQCDLEFCERCWAKLHKNNNKIKNPHQRIQIQIGPYGCEEHSNMPREFYCKDDEEPICAYCGLTGSHRGHQIVPIDQQNVEVQDQLKPAFDTAKGVLKRLYHSKQILEKASQKVKKETAPAAEGIRTTFLTLHAMLQRRESILLQELETLESDKQDRLDQMGRSVRNNISRLETVMSDVAKSLKGASASSPNLSEMISILNSAADLPCHSVKEGGGENSSVAFNPGAEITRHIMSHGALETKGAVKWDLKSTEELPEGHKLPNIPESILSSSKLFSVSAAGKSEIKSPRTSEKKDQNHVVQVSGVTANGHDHVQPKQKQQQAKGQNQTTPTTRTKKPTTQTAPKRVGGALPNRDLVYVVHIRSPARFYVQRKSDRPHLEKMMKALYKLCESEDKKKRKPNPLVIGTRCCCKFSADNQWYRAMVKTLPEALLNGAPLTDEEEEDEEEKQPKVEVLYIDYGNTEWVPVSRLCKLRPKYEREPDLALCCSLVDIVSTKKDGRWTREASEAFQGMVESQNAVLMSIRGQVGSMLYVDLHQQPNNDVKDDMPVSLRDALVFLELACFISPESIPKTQSIVPPKRFLPPNVPTKGDEILIQVSHITDPHHFSIQEFETTDYLEDMMSKIQKAYGSRMGHEWQVLCPQPGLVCMAFYEEDKRWYRSEVIRISGNQEVEVLYVDFGNKATVHFTYLRKMSDDFLKLSRLSLSCSLADVAPKDSEHGWTDESKLFFSQCVSFKPTEVTVMDVKDGVISVLIFEEEADNRVCVNALMVQKGLAETTGPGSMSAELLRGPSPTHKPKPAAEETMQSQTEQDQPTPKPNTTAAETTQSESQQDQPTPKENPAAEERTQSQSEQDIDPTQANGTGADPTAEDIPAQNDVTPTPEPKEQLPSETLSSHQTVAQDLAPSVAVVPEANASNAKTPSPMKVTRGGPTTVAMGGTTGGSSSTHQSGKYLAYTAVHVSHVESPACIYVQLSTAGKDGLDSLLEAMTLHYKERKEECESTGWKEGDVCGALLVREGVWCRARVQCLLPDGSAVVLFTDYGNAEVVSLTNIRPLEDKFQKEAPFAIKCHLVDILPAGGTSEWTKTACDFLEERLNDLECFICKKGDVQDGSMPIDLLYELSDKQKLAQETLEDLASISELIIQNGLALRKRRKINRPSRSKSEGSPSNIPSKPDVSCQSPSSHGTSPLPPHLTSPRPSHLTSSHRTPPYPYHTTLLTPPSSGVSSLNTTASPHPRDITLSPHPSDTPLSPHLAENTHPTPEGGRTAAHIDSAVMLDEFENFEGAGMAEIQPQYVPPPLPIVSQMQLIVTFVSTEGLIHALEVERFHEFERMMVSQQDECNAQSVAPPDPSSLSLCQCLCARFTQDDQWYRAQVIGITEDSVRVKYIDFGNTESVPCDRILTTPYQMEVPIYRRECIIHGIQPKSPNKTWPPEVIKFLLELLVEKTCTAHIKAICILGEPMKIELALPTGESVTQILLSRGYAEVQPDFEDFDAGCPDDASTITDGTSTPFSRAMSEDGDEVSCGAGHSVLPSAAVVDVLRGVAEAELEEEAGPIMAVAGQTYAPVLLPEPGVEFLVTVTHLDEPDLVYLQYTSASEDDEDPTIALSAQQLLLFDASVTELCNMAASLPFLLNPQPEMPCCAQYGVDQQWYRAEITDVVRKDILMCHVKFVDYGTVEWLTLNSIRQLPERFLELPIQARRSRLGGVRAPSTLPPDTPLQPGTLWPAASIKRMVELVSNQILVACVEEDGPIPSVSLYDNTPDRRAISEILIGEGLAESSQSPDARLLKEAAREIGLLISAGTGDGSVSGGHTGPDVCEHPRAADVPAASKLEE